MASRWLSLSSVGAGGPQHLPEERLSSSWVGTWLSGPTLPCLDVLADGRAHGH